MDPKDERNNDEAVRDSEVVPPDAVPRTPVDRGGALPPVEPSEDEVDDASEESFPASDPPAYSRIT